uniref:Uncharacterized protein n=1 Tax=Myotis myotis TaxID=51298 RepID=A0A7J8ALT7_MYOMY|nr:hypothetical protein mMyoMyo1_007906 [Myotis myotis]
MGGGSLSLTCTLFNLGALRGALSNPKALMAYAHSLWFSALCGAWLLHSRCPEALCSPEALCGWGGMLASLQWQQSKCPTPATPHTLPRGPLQLGQDACLVATVMKQASHPGRYAPTAQRPSAGQRPSAAVAESLPHHCGDKACIPPGCSHCLLSMAAPPTRTGGFQQG